MQQLSEQVEIPLGDRSYKIVIGTGLLCDPHAFGDLPTARDAVIVSNTTVAPLYAAQLTETLQQKYKKIHLVQLPDGEKHKNWQTLHQIFDAMLAAGCDRKTPVVALGGGVVGDMAGFAAACYMRGVPFVQVPTTLLSQVDSSVGGKTGINHELGKNMIGAFYQPRRVVADIDTLSTLSPREFSAGLAEVIKYGPIADESFVAWLEANMDALLERQPEALAFAIRRSCEIKAQVVGADERESGLRAILNFGHTFGHAIETGLGYGQWLHGEAVGCGMVMALELSHRLGLIDRAYVTRVTNLIERARLPIRGPSISADDYLRMMRLDKKSEAGEIRFVVIERPGVAAVRSAPDAMVAGVVEQLTGA